MALLAALWYDLSHLDALVANPIFWIATAFQVWMLVDALRRGEWIWAACILVFSFLSALFYFLMVYRQQGPAGGGGGAMGGFELPGAGRRRREKELQSRIYHLDHARDHLDLADIHFAAGKLAKAEAGYRESLKRDPSDIDAIAHLGQCLLRQGRAAEARPLLEQALAQDPRHDYGHTRMAQAEALASLGDKDGAIASWRRVLEHHAYARARVQLAELLAERGVKDEAARILDELVADDAHSPRFQRGRDKTWIRRAKRLRSTLG